MYIFYRNIYLSSKPIIRILIQLCDGPYRSMIGSTKAQSSLSRSPHAHYSPFIHYFSWDRSYEHVQRSVVLPANRITRFATFFFVASISSVVSQASLSITLTSFFSDTFYSPCLNFVAPLRGTNEKCKITNKRISRITITIRDTLRENLFTYKVNSSPKINEAHPDTSTVEKVLIRLVLFHRTRVRQSQVPTGLPARCDFAASNVTTASTTTPLLPPPLLCYHHYHDQYY